MGPRSIRPSHAPDRLVADPHWLDLLADLLDAGPYMLGREGDEYGLISLCAAAVHVLVRTAHRNAARHRLAREAVAEMLRLLSVSELAHVLAWRSEFRFSPFYAPYCNRLRELAMLEVAKRASASVIDDRGAQLNLPGL